jgi:type II secretory pathway pseudopilin PulG
MKLQRSSRHARREAGYALLMVVFMASVMLIVAMAAAPNLLTQGRREKEEELVWRGQQYARAVRLYYRKNGRFPQSVEDLAKAKNQVRFLRKAYADPMNPDGSWRLIYVTPGGQVVGSLKRRSLLQMPGTTAQPGTALQGQPGAQQPSATGATGGMQPGTGDQTASGGTSGTSSSGQPSGQPGAPTAGGTDLSSPTTVLGGNIIGVGSKVNRRSVRVYDGAANYREWEFMWDPSKDVVAGQPGSSPQQGPQQQQQQQQQPQQQQQNPLMRPP